MKFNDIFDITPKLCKEENTVSLTIRIFGIDFSFELYGNITDWLVPFGFMPGIRMRGVLVQVLFLAVYVGRLRKEVEVVNEEVAEDDQIQED